MSSCFTEGKCYCTRTAAAQQLLACPSPGLAQKQTLARSGRSDENTGERACGERNRKKMIKRHRCYLENFGGLQGQSAPCHGHPPCTVSEKVPGFSPSSFGRPSFSECHVAVASHTNSPLTRALCSRLHTVSCCRADCCEAAVQRPYTQRCPQHPGSSDHQMLHSKQSESGCLHRR